jgi:hypothetical protein
MCRSPTPSRRVSPSALGAPGIACWIVDLDSRLVERWVPGEDRPSIHAVELVWQPVGASAPFVIALEPFLVEVLGPA